MRSYCQSPSGENKNTDMLYCSLLLGIVDDFNNTRECQNNEVEYKQDEQNIKDSKYNSFRDSPAIIINTEE